MRSFVLRNILFVSFIGLACALRSAQAEPFPRDALREVAAEHVPQINQVILLCHLAGVYDDAGFVAESKRCMDEAFRRIDAVPAGVVRDWLRNKSANKLAHSYASKPTAYLQQFDQAYAEALKIVNPAVRSHAHAKLAQKRAKNDRAQATRMFFAAAADAEEIENSAERAAALIVIGKEMASVGMTDEAAPDAECGQESGGFHGGRRAAYGLARGDRRQLPRGGRSTRSGGARRSDRRDLDARCHRIHRNHSHV
ncbi:MAG: hypothetical protein QM775_29940 [Pirellulales bacterium]